MKGITDTVAAFKLVWVRVACYFLIPFATAFLDSTKSVTGEQWDLLHWFDRMKLVGSPAVVGLVAFVAYLDSSMQRAKGVADQMKEKRETETQFRNKDAPNG